MSRKKKTRSLKDKLTVKTGSRKNFLKPGQKGQIPSKNKLAKHTQRQKSAYEKFLEQQAQQENTDDIENGSAIDPDDETDHEQ